MKIAHAALWVQDLEQQKDFYKSKLGGSPGMLYHNRRKGFSSYFVRFETGAKLELMHQNDVNGMRPDPARERLGYAHLAFSVGSSEAVDSLFKQLRDDGVKIISEPRITGDGFYEAVIADPEGNRIELMA